MLSVGVDFRNLRKDLGSKDFIKSNVENTKNFEAYLDN